MFLGFGLRYWLHLFLDYNHTFILPFFSLMSLSPCYRGLSALYSLLGCILAFHLEGLSLFLLILVLSRLHWKASIPCYELWWHCSRVWVCLLFNYLLLLLFTLLNSYVIMLTKFAKSTKLKRISPIWTNLYTNYTVLKQHFFLMNNL